MSPAEIILVGIVMFFLGVLSIVSVVNSHLLLRLISRVERVIRIAREINRSLELFALDMVVRNRRKK